MVLLACGAATGWGRRLRERTPAGEGGDGAPRRRGLDGGSCLCAAAARADYASQPAPLPPRAPAPRPPAGSRLLIAALTRPRRHPCSWPRYLGADGLTAGADGLTARPAGSGMGAPTGERARGAWGACPGQALSAAPARSAGVVKLSRPLEDAPRRWSLGRPGFASPAASCLPGPAAQKRVLRGRRGREAPAGCGSHALHCGSAASAARRAAAVRARSLLSSPGCGAGFFHAGLCSPLSPLL